MVFGQTEAKYVINNQGQHNVIGSIQVISSFGEPVVTNDSLAFAGFLFSYDTLYITSVPAIESTNLFTFYPNPAIDFIQFSAINQIENIFLHDVQGKLLKEEHPFATKFSLDVSMLLSGTYIVSVHLSNEIKPRKAKVIIN